MISRIGSVVAAVLVCAYGTIASAMFIGPANNGDFSFGDTTNWVTEQGSSQNLFEYQDVGAPHSGSLHSVTSLVGASGDKAYHSTLVPVGADGSVDFKINSLNANNGYFGIGFLGDPVYHGGGIPTHDNNDYVRGYVIEVINGANTAKIDLFRKTGYFGATKLQEYTIPMSSLGNNWHTVAIDDAAGLITVQLDGNQILQVNEGASYLPTAAAYTADYATGAYWGVYDDSRASYADVSFDNLSVVPEPMTLLLLGSMLPVLAIRARRRA